MKFKNILKLKEGCDKRLPTKQRKVKDKLHCCKYQLCKECKLKIQILESVVKELREYQWIGCGDMKEIVIRGITGEPEHKHFVSGS